MKKTILALTLGMVLICAGACTLQEKVTESRGDSTVFTDSSVLPNNIAITEDNFFVLGSMLDKDNYAYRFAVGKELSDLNFVYDIEDVLILHLEAEGDYAAWVEVKLEDDSDDAAPKSYDYKVYDHQKGSVESIFKIRVGDNGSQNTEIGLYKSILYYNEIDYSTNTIFIKSYNLKDKTTQIIYKSDFPEIVGVALEVKDGVLVSYAYTGNGNVIYKRDLDTGDEKTIKIPGEVSAFYAVSYDKDNDLYAIYYEDETGPRLGTFADGDDKIKQVYTFGENEYAIYDIIKLIDGHLLWTIRQKGDLEGYIFIDYTCADETHVAHDKAFGFAVGRNSLYIVSFEDGIDNIEIQRKEYP